MDNVKDLYSKGEHCVCYGTILFYGELFDKSGGLTRKLTGAEDYEYITKLLSYGVDNLPDKLYYYRSHPGQRSREFYNKESIETKSDHMEVLLTMDNMNIRDTEANISIFKKLGGVISQFINQAKSKMQTYCKMI